MAFLIGKRAQGSLLETMLAADRASTTVRVIQ